MRFHMFFHWEPEETIGFEELTTLCPRAQSDTDPIHLFRAQRGKPPPQRGKKILAQGKGAQRLPPWVKPSSISPPSRALGAWEGGRGVGSFSQGAVSGYANHL